MNRRRQIDYISRKLGIEVGESTTDGKFTLLTVECLGSCGTAPMMQVDETYCEESIRLPTTRRFYQ